MNMIGEKEKKKEQRFLVGVHFLCMLQVQHKL